ncbi:MAG: pseudouridylate synthase [Gammaproteobacteria bacterium]|nr:MAG: pseudouridylate synthase [Gammaproteobacteria bacterium]
MRLPILHIDDHLVVIHKPPGLLVHRSALSRDRMFVLQTLRDQIGQRVWPVHRLDRATSGVMVFALDPKVARDLAGQFERHEVKKEYRALVRGWTDEQGVIDHPIRDAESGAALQRAVTRYRRLARVELPVAVDRYPTSRYSLVAVEPLTGRRHQIRRHLKHISHHLIGDTTYGSGRHNRFFRERYDIHRLMLTAERLTIVHPVTGERMQFTALPEPEWQRVFTAFGWHQAQVPGE